MSKISSREMLSKIEATTSKFDMDYVIMLEEEEGDEEEEAEEEEAEEEENE